MCVYGKSTRFICDCEMNIFIERLLRVQSKAGVVTGNGMPRINEINKGNNSNPMAICNNSSDN